MRRSIPRLRGVRQKSVWRHLRTFVPCPTLHPWPLPFSPLLTSLRFSAPEMPRPSPALEQLIRTRVRGGVTDPPVDDTVPREEPLEIRINGRSVAVLLRTPGQDDELAVGFLLTEGIIGDAAQVDRVQPCATAPALSAGNIVDVILDVDARPDFSRHGEARYANSACGVCGVAALENLTRTLRAVPAGAHVTTSLVESLPALLRAQQPVFDATGGVHAAGILGAGTELICVREDVGRHNATDKSLGALALAHASVSPRALCVTSRAGFEIVEKAHARAVPIVVAVGAPTSLAVAAAERAGITLCAFTSASGFNIYSHAHRIISG